MIVAIEGIDASGKETQAKRLATLAEGFKKVRVVSFPDYGTRTGKLIKSMLNGEVLDLASSEGALTFQSLMTSNRYEKYAKLVEYSLRRDKLLILDRYYLSGVVYGQASGVPREWLLDVHKALPDPDYWVLVDVPVAMSFDRKTGRDGYEAKSEFLSRARSLYLEEFARLSNGIVVDGTKDSEEVTKQITRKVPLVR